MRPLKVAVRPEAADDLAAIFGYVLEISVIAYKIDGDLVQITNIFYGGRNYEALYRGVRPEDVPV